MKFRRYQAFHALFIIGILLAAFNEEVSVCIKRKHDDDLQETGSEKLCSSMAVDNVLSMFTEEEQIRYLCDRVVKEGGGIVQKYIDDMILKCKVEEGYIIEGAKISEQIPKGCAKENVIVRLVEKIEAYMVDRRLIILNAKSDFIDYLKAHDRDVSSALANLLTNATRPSVEEIYVMAELAISEGLESIRLQVLLMITELNPYDFTNSEFLFVLLYYPSPKLTLEAIQTRFTPFFLHSLSVHQFINVIRVILSNSLGLINSDKKDIIGLLFGNLDYATNMRFNSAQVSTIVVAIMESNVPECFEEVYLTWKMWLVFKPEEQVAMLRSANVGQDKVTSLMLYLFALNKNGPNSKICGKFKKEFISKFIGPESNDQKILEEIIISPVEKHGVIRNMLIIFDELLIYLPEILPNVDTRDFRKIMLDSFVEKNGFELSFFLRYRIHVSYALTKYTEFGDNSGILDRIYFNYTNFKNGFRRTLRMENTTNRYSENKLRNSFGAIRQITQDKDYNIEVFYELLEELCLSNYSERLYVLVLFSLTDKAVFEGVELVVEKTKKIFGYRGSKSNRYCFMRYSYIFMSYFYNSDLVSLDEIKVSAKFFVSKIMVINKNMPKIGPLGHRGCYLLKWVIFHPEFKLYKTKALHEYIATVLECDYMENSEHIKQLARDIANNKYYCDNSSLNSLTCFNNSPYFIEMMTNEVKYYEERNKDDKMSIKEC